MPPHFFDLFDSVYSSKFAQAHEKMQKEDGRLRKYGNKVDSKKTNETKTIQ